MDSKFGKLCSAAIHGDWKKAEEILKQNPKEITPSTGLNLSGETSLHIAVRAGQTELVEKLVEMMTREELAIETTTGDTALSSAFRQGHIEIATIILKKNPHLGLATLRKSSGWNWKYCSPISSLFRHNRMVIRLYEVTKNLLDERDHIDLLLTLFDLCLYDIASEMLSENQGLSLQVNSKGETALYAIASRKVSKARKERIDLIKQLLKQANGHSDLIKRALFRAAREGNFEFLTQALHLYPGLAFEVDDNEHTIFHVTVLHRHVDVFNMIRSIDSVRISIKLMTDRERINILHLAAKLPLSGLDVVPGEALQLQRELLWFEEVKKVVGVHHKESKKKSSYTLLFDKEHEELRREGEKWMAKTAGSCGHLAILITTVSYLTGMVAFRDNSVDDDFWFETFAFSNAMTVLFSGCSALSFFAILLAPFSMNALLKGLPFKFLLALFSLVTSILAMMASSFAAFFGTFELRFAYPYALVAFISLPFLARLYLPLLYHFSCSMLMSSLQFRRTRVFFSTIREHV